MDGEGTTAMRTQGLSKVGLEHLHEVMAGHVGAGRVPGLVLALSRGDDVHTDAIGGAAVGGGEPSRPEPLFRLTSMTRPVPAVRSGRPRRPGQTGRRPPRGPAAA